MFYMKNKRRTSVIFVYLSLAVLNSKGYAGSSVEAMSPVSIKPDWEVDPILPKDTIPYHYDLYLHPDLENGTFSGTALIKIQVTKPRKHLTLHSHLLDITKSELYNENKSKIAIEEAFSYEPNEFWVMKLKEAIVPGKYEMNLTFSGSLTKSIVGFYRSTYTTEDGKKRYIVTTKFEPTYARRAFPCFDEPRYKAEFVIHIVRPSENNYFALSNMNQVMEEPDYPSPGLTKVSFAPTPPMSTYLACFIVCDFEHLEPVYTSQGTPITLYARPGFKHKLEFSRDIAKKSMDYYISYFDIEYPLPKIDLIAIPDFVSGAMENWGLITFRETQILVSDEGSVSDKDSCANTVAHELAHMWFGNLVTMEWWDDLWLNEGFATFMSYKVVDIIQEDLFSQVSFVTSKLQPVLVDDAAEASHPIIQPVTHPDQITEIFDAISYSKGSSFIRMIENFQPDNFQKGVSTYLKAHKFKNAITDDLWQELNATLSLPNTERMLNTFTKQKGYPLLSIQQDNEKIIISQKKFLLDASEKINISDSPFGFKWDVPITYITSNDKDVHHAVFSLDENELILQLEPNTEWFKINSNQQGFFRVNYTKDQWLGFIPLLQSQVLKNPLDRANLIDDAFSLAKAGYLDYEIPFKLVSYLKEGKEKHYSIWKEASEYFIKYKKILHGTPAINKLLALAGTLLEPVVSNDLWDVNASAPNSEKLLKSVLLSFSCNMEIPQVIARANDIFVNWIEGKSDKPNQNIIRLVYKYGVRGSNEEAYRKKLWDLYVNETDANEKRFYMSGIATVTNPKMIAELLELMKDESKVRTQDYFTFISFLCQSPEGGEYVWQYMRKNWKYYVDRFTLNDRSLGRVLPAAVAYFSTEEKLKEVEQFIKDNPEAGAGASGRKKAIETIKTNIKWHKQYYGNIEKALNTLVI